MRSSLPKLLHPLCGRPLIAWPIAAAREAGAGKVVVVDGPKRRLAEHLPEGVVAAIQEEPRGTGDAVAAAAGEIGEGETVVVVLGDVPLVDADTLSALVAAHEEAGAAATMLTAELEDPTGYGRVVRDAEGQVERVVETKTAGDATEQELAIREVNTGIFAFDGGGAARRADAAGVRQRPGRAVPPRRAAAPARGGRRDRRPRGERLDAHARHQRPRRPRARPRARPAGASTSATCARA